MITVTWAEIRSGVLYMASEDLCLYAIKERTGQIIYVGKSRDPFGRLCQHIGEGQDLPSLIGRFILDYLPESDAWEIDLYELLECYELIGEEYKYKKYLNRREVMIIDSRVDRAETVLIRKYTPYFNSAKMSGLNPVPLPVIYCSYLEKTSKQIVAALMAISPRTPKG